jgi:ribosomal protein S12 methylthiotransferase
MQLQQGITRQKNMERIDQVVKVLISSHPSKNMYLGRAYFQAPQVDGLIMVKSEDKLPKGDFIPVKLKGIRKYDMIGEPVDEYSK